MPLSQPRNSSTAWPIAWQRQALCAALLLVLGTALFQGLPSLVREPHRILSGDILYLHTLLRSLVLLCGGFAVAFLLEPLGTAALERARQRLSPASRRALVLLAVLACALGLPALLLSFGRHQFGAWDFGILIDTGYRQLLGQRPYVDFVAPTPPFFNWTAALAFRLFGLSWDANLYLAALFCGLTLVWFFLLLRELRLSSAAALGTACAVEVAAMLTTAFWWYNNTTLLLAALFFLASLLLIGRPRSFLAQISFAVLLAVLPLTKPNIAAPTLAGCVLLTLVASPQRLRVLVLVLAGSAGAVVLFLLLHVPLPAMLATYRGIARERGGLSAFGFNQLSTAEQLLVALWTCALSLPLLLLVRPLRDDLRHHRWAHAAKWLFFPLAALVGVYGLMGNGEYRDVEFPPLLCGIALLAFGRPSRSIREAETPGLARRFTVALLCALVVNDLYVGAMRLRTYTVGAHTFFEWGDTSAHFRQGFLKHLQASQTLAAADSEVKQVVATNPGPVFLGPRLDFEYAALGLPSPPGWASFFQPGTAFGRDLTPVLLQHWKDSHFQTLVFLKENYTFYPDALLGMLRDGYVRDDHYRHLTVFRRRGPGA